VVKQLFSNIYTLLLGGLLAGLLSCSFCFLRRIIQEGVEKVNG